MPKNQTPNSRRGQHAAVRSRVERAAPPSARTSPAALEKLKQEARLLRRRAQEARAHSEQLREQLYMVAADFHRASSRFGRNTGAAEGRRAPLVQILRQAKQLLPQDGLLRQLSGSLLSAMEEERSRIARELHDDLNQNVALLRFHIDTLRQSPPASSLELESKLRMLADGLDELSVKISQISRQLHPAALADLGLEAALRSYVKRFAQDKHIQAVFRAHNVPRQLSAQVSICLYRILQEALRNVSKHARTRRLTVSLSVPENQLRLVVRDYGVGLDGNSENHKQGLGLISMEERARLIHGRFLLTSQPGKGTQVEVRVPLTSAGESSAAGPAGGCAVPGRAAHPSEEP